MSEPRYFIDKSTIKRIECTSENGMIVCDDLYDGCGVKITLPPTKGTIPVLNIERDQARDLMNTLKYYFEEHDKEEKDLT